MPDTGNPYKLPWPEYDDPADGPASFKALAQAVNTALNTLQTNITGVSNSVLDGIVTNGSVQLGGYPNGTYQFIATRSGGIRTAYWVDASKNSIIQTQQLISNGGVTATATFWFRPDGRIQAQAAGGVARVLPFGIDTGIAAIGSIAAGVTGKSVKLPFKTTFSAHPVVVAITNDKDLVVGITGITNTYATVVVRNVDGAAQATGRSIYWIAVQE